MKVKVTYGYYVKIILPNQGNLPLDKRLVSSDGDGVCCGMSSGESACCVCMSQ